MRDDSWERLDDELPVFQADADDELELATGSTGFRGPVIGGRPPETTEEELELELEKLEEMGSRQRAIAARIRKLLREM